MDRVNGTDWVDIGGGRRGFRSQNAAAGVPGTEVTDKILNDVQEEICAVIENSGFVLDPDNQQQLWEALQSIAAPGFANRTAWLPVISMTVTAPPNDASLGDAYVIPADATGTWAGNQQKLAEWTGSSWRIVETKDGHGVGLPDGRIFERVGGVYVEKVAIDAQSGKWSYAVAAGSANALTATLTPAPAALVAGLVVRVRVASSNTGAATLNVNGLGAKPIVRASGGTLEPNDLIAGAAVELLYDGTNFQIAGLNQMWLPKSNKLIFQTGVRSWIVPDGVYSVNFRIWGGGGGGGGGLSGSGAGGGGGAGYVEGQIAVVPGQEILITVGGGGAGGPANTTGINGVGGTGGTSSFGSFASATGGLGGSPGGIGGVGGAGVGGNFSITGQPAANAYNDISPKHGSGGGGTFGTPGSPMSVTGGVRAGSPGGGGGGGANGFAGSIGGAGLIYIEY